MHKIKNNFHVSMCHSIYLYKEGTLTLNSKAALIHYDQAPLLFALLSTGIMKTVKLWGKHITKTIAEMPIFKSKL